MNGFFSTRSVIIHTSLLSASFIMCYPLLWMLSSALKPASEVFSEGLIPSVLTLENFSYGWNALGVSFTRFFTNSLVMCGLAVVGTTLSSALTAYAFARLNFRFKRTAFALMLLTIMLPGFVTVIPEYMIFRALGWINTSMPIWVPTFFAVNGFFVFLHVQFIRGIPRELDEAATLDGANKWQIFWYIILPATKPALITTAIFAFVWTWDNFFGQLIYLSNIQVFTVPLALQAFMDSMGESSYGPLFAMSVLSLVPAFAFFIFAQRYIVEGIATTGFKG
ncbi:MAG: carbohydrate ABC transporter permease [Alphaproteobacteria bacterium]|nr:MAG: carbohydrate ABC transporter permease [Alphaproteobacteria bacterium]